MVLLDVLMGRSLLGRRRGTLAWRGRPVGSADPGSETMGP
jgi:hypothetical protein